MLVYHASKSHDVSQNFASLLVVLFLTWLSNCGGWELNIVVSGGRSGIDIKLKLKRYLNMFEL